MTGRASSTQPVPADFPQSRPPAALAGAQPKLAVRKMGGTFSADFTPEELTARYSMCDDLLVQLLPYCNRKRREHPAWTESQLLTKVAASLRIKGWDLTEPEIEWLVGQLSTQLKSD
jgi:hypothetical protein